MQKKKIVTAADMGMSWHLPSAVGFVLLFSLGIAALIKLLVPASNLLTSFAVSCSYSVPICLMISLLIRVAPGMRLWVVLAIAIFVGEVTGTLANGIASSSEGRVMGHGLGGLLSYIGVGLIFSVTGVSIFYLRSRMIAMRMLWQREQLQNANQEKLLAESRLQALQSQIEPHFIFNTLANVQSLIEADPAAARRMLESFTRLLRHTLKRSRDGDTTLGQEIEILREYLAIQQQRLGTRLSYRIDVAEPLQTRLFPSLLLQPLVENAIKHGIEPAIAGGEVSVTTRTDGARLFIDVRDTGRGFVVSNEPGIGLANVRARLASLYGERGQLTLKENDGRGVVATVEVPLDERA